MKAWILLGALAAVGCSTPSCAKYLPPVPVNGDACGAAETTISNLGGCGLPVRFTADACHRAADDGRSWHPECLARITDCTQLESAYRGVCP